MSILYFALVMLYGCALIAAVWIGARLWEKWCICAAY